MIIYVLMNIGFLLTIYGSILYSPALIPEPEEMTPEGARMELINDTRGAFIAQHFDIPRYNIGFDLLNIGGILILIGTLFYNYIETKTFSKNQRYIKGPKLFIYKLREKGFFQGNIIEWLCVIVFCFAFFTFLYNFFFYVIIVSFILGIIGYTFRKFYNFNQESKKMTQEDFSNTKF